MTATPDTADRRTLRSEVGTSMVEVLVVCATLAGVCGAVLGLLDNAGKNVPRDVEWSQAVTESRTGLQRMVREARQASVVNGVTPNRIDFDTTLGGVQRRVMYACDVPMPTGTLRRCVRVEAASGAALPAPSTGETVVARVQNATGTDPVFTFAPDAIRPTYLTVRVLVPSTGERAGDRPGHSVVLEDGAALRNQDLGG